MVLAALGFGVFLFNLIYNLLNRSARSIEVSDMNLVIRFLIVYLTMKLLTVITYLCIAFAIVRPTRIYHEFLRKCDNFPGKTSTPFYLVSSQSVVFFKDFEWNKATSEDVRRNKLFAKSMHVGRKITDAVAKNPETCSKALLCYLANDDVAWNRQPALLLRGVQLYM